MSFWFIFIVVVYYLVGNRVAAAFDAKLILKRGKALVYARKLLKYGVGELLVQIVILYAVHPYNPAGDAHYGAVRGHILKDNRAVPPYLAAPRL